MSVKAARYLCGTPKEVCCGSVTIMAKGLVNHTGKAHGSRADALRCYVAWKLSQGYTRTNDKRLLAAPDGGPCLVLSKISHFGTRIYWADPKVRYRPRAHAGTMTGS